MLVFYSIPHATHKLKYFLCECGHRFPISANQSIIKCSVCLRVYVPDIIGWECTGDMYEHMVKRNEEYEKENQPPSTINGQSLWRMARHDGFDISIKEIYNFAVRKKVKGIQTYLNNGHQYPIDFYKKYLFPWLNRRK